MEKLIVNPYLAVLLYFSHYFVLLEMTQIRVGFASAIFFIAILFYLKNKRWIFFLLVLLAISFHYSAVLYLAVLIFNNRDLNRYLYSGILVLSILLGLIKLPLFDILGRFSPDVFVGKLQGYEYISKYGNDLSINTFNVVYIANVISIFYLLFFVPKAVMKQDIPLMFFIKGNILSIFLLSFLSGVPLIAFRVSELFGILSFFMFAAMTPYLPFKRLNIVFPVMLAALFFYINYFHNDILNPYRIVHFR
jgi:hypothetical protein